MTEKLNIIQKINYIINHADYNKTIIDLRKNENKWNKELLTKVLYMKLDAFIDYVNIIYQTETTLPLLQFRDISQREYISEIEKWDLKRRNAHNNAITSVLAINHICEQYGFKPICPILKDQTFLNLKQKTYSVGQNQTQKMPDIAPEYREKIGQWCGEVVLDVFNNRNASKISYTHNHKSKKSDFLEEAIALAKENKTTYKSSEMEFE